MKLKWKGNQKYNESINKATARTIDSPMRMSIHRYIGCGNNLFFTCAELGVSTMDLKTESFEEAEIKVIEILKNKRGTLVEKIESILDQAEVVSSDL